VIGGIGAALLLLIVAVLQSVHWYQPRITQAEVKRQIQKGLPMGSTIAQTIAFLGARGWIDPHNVGLYPNRGNGSSDGFEQKDPRGSTLTASIPDAYPGVIVSGGIYMKFGFDAKGRLTRYQLRDVYTGP
jgi:hypothetical protein